MFVMAVLLFKELAPSSLPAVDGLTRKMPVGMDSASRSKLFVQIQVDG